MFVFNRSALPVLLPLAMLVAVVLWSNRASEPAPRTQSSVAESFAPHGDSRAVAAEQQHAPRSADGVTPRG